jgi:hypothetical protein
LEGVADKMSYFENISIDLIPAAASGIEAIIYSKFGIIAFAKVACYA